MLRATIRSNFVVLKRSFVITHEAIRYLFPQSLATAQLLLSSVPTESRSRVRIRKELRQPMNGYKMNLGSNKHARYACGLPYFFLSKQVFAFIESYLKRKRDNTAIMYVDEVL